MVDLVLARTRRLAGLLVAFALVTSLPLAAARAGCVCAHGHQHDATATAASHTCTAACTPTTCPMHRGGKAAVQAAPDTRRTGDGMRCGCAGEAQTLIGQATIAGVLPAAVSLDAPTVTRASRATIVETPLSLAAAPPAPPPRA